MGKNLADIHALLLKLSRRLVQHKVEFPVEQGFRDFDVDMVEQLIENGGLLILLILIVDFLLEVAGQVASQLLNASHFVVGKFFDKIVVSIRQFAGL